MNKVFLALGLTVLVSGGAGAYLYTEGYFVTWETKKAELKDELVKEFIQAGAPEDMAEEVADCVAGKVIDTVKQADCPLDTKVSALEMVQACVRSKPNLGMELGLGTLTCVAEVQGKVEGSQSEDTGPVEEELTTPDQN